MYQLIANSDSIKRLSDGAIIPNNPSIGAWQDYQDWLAQGNTPSPADPEPAPPPAPEWLEFNTTLFTDSDWLATADLLLEGLKIGLYANASAGDAKALQSTLDISLNYLNETQQPIDLLVLQRWQKLAEKHHIPITLTQHANL